MNSLPLEPAVVAPLVTVAVGALVVLVFGVLFSRARTLMSRAVTASYVGVLFAATSIFFLCVAGLLALQQAAWPDPVVFNPSNAMLIADRFSGALSLLILTAALCTCALAVTYLDELDINHGEFYALVLFACAGMLVLVSAVDLLVLCLGMSLMSLPLCVLAGFNRAQLRSNEAGLKLLLLGGVASAILFYGMALLYGASGATSYDALRGGLTPETPLAMIGLGLVVVGFAFKLAAVPFHQWAPDVYEGAPAVVVAFLSVAAKVAAVGALLRIVAVAFVPAAELLENLLWWMAAATLVVGSLMSLVQENVKRLLAYSAVVHAGFVLIGVVAGSVESFGSVVFYLICYAFTNLGAFAVVVSLANHGRDFERISDFAGLARSRPGLAGCMALFLISLAGMPTTAGFMAKWRVAATAIEAGHMPLALLGVFASAVSLYYYLRIPMLMYMREPTGPDPRRESSTPELFVLALCAVAVLYLGIVPNALFPTLSWAHASVTQLFGS